MAMIYQCFAAAEKEYAFYIRVRPDSFFAKPLPPLHSFKTDKVSTWMKYDALGSDQFFIMTLAVYRSWWLAVVETKIKSGSFSCCPEYDIFSPDIVSQRHDIYCCLLRDSNKLACWRSKEDNQAHALEPQFAVPLAKYQETKCQFETSNFSGLMDLVDKAFDFP